MEIIGNNNVCEIYTFEINIHHFYKYLSVFVLYLFIYLFILLYLYLFIYPVFSHLICLCLMANPRCFIGDHHSHYMYKRV